MQRGSLRRAARQDERRERIELLFTGVDGCLELSDALVGHPRLLELLLVLCRVRGGQEGADREEVPLHWREHFVDAWHHLHGAGHAEHGIEFVDVAVCLDAQVVLGHAASAEKARAAVVTGLGVDPVRHPRNTLSRVSHTDFGFGSASARVSMGGL